MLKILIGRRILRDKLSFLFRNDVFRIENFLREVFRNERSTPNEKINQYIPILLKHGYISPTENNYSKSKCSLMFTEAVNFELTYQCNSYCPHCLQSNFRREIENPLPTEKVKELIYQAFISGVCEVGINFTGGEVLGNRSDFFDILEYTHSLGIPFRINSNSWWAGKGDLSICGILFRTADDMLKYLKSLGLKIFAFSFDERYHGDLSLAKNLLESIRLCEANHLDYEIIFTGVDTATMNYFTDQIKIALGIKLRYMTPGQSEMVDIGGAAELDREKFAWQSNRMFCESKGFYRPRFLHVSPSGKIRTCLYAIGLCNFGDVTTESFADLINKFPENPNNLIFSDNEKNKVLLEAFVNPYLGMYQPIYHGCTKSIILAKTLEQFSKQPKPQLQKIHQSISAELNLRFCNSYQ